MFKKTFDVKSSTKLRGSDQRKLRDEVEAMLEASNSGGEDLPDGGSVSVLFGEPLTRMSVDVGGPQRIAAYGRGANVVFVRVDPVVESATNSISTDGILLPTVYALSIEPKLLPHVVTHAGVVRRLMQGADLMLPGVLKPVETPIQKGDAVAIMSNGSPVAVAFAAMDATEMVSSGMRGKGFVVVHVVGDALFATGDGVIATPNSEAQLDSDEYDDDDDDSDFVVVEREDVGPAAVTRADSDPVVLEMETMSLYDSESIVKVENAPSIQQSPQEMDRMLEQALLTSIKISLPQDSKAYPMPVTSLYSLHMQLVDPSLEVKNSTYKKLAKFLKTMEKRGYLKLKERQGGELVLVSVNAAHPEVSAFVVDQRTAKQIQKNARVTDCGASSSAATNIASAAQDQFIQITDLFKSTASVARMWKDVGIQKDSLFTRAEVKQAVETYIKAQDLVNKENPRLIKIDAYLADAILSKDEFASVQFLARDAILDRICDKMTPMHSISAPGSNPVLRKGAVKPLSILVEKRQGRKTVTRVSNMESYLIPPEELATRLKVPCAASTTVAPLQGGGGSSGKPLLHEVLVQGNKVHEVCVVLRELYGFMFQGGGKGAKLGIKGGSQCRYVEVVDKS
ncbi:Eukaryotic translation initiation factor 2D [Chytriomyces hyalinus]|nr:Eukaryotic translation initiation factor 2D [Chytriomyces hyalinus]